MEKIKIMALKSLNDLPPWGFFCFCPETNFETPKHIGLEDAARALQQHRVANPRFGWATDIDSCRQHIIEYTEARLRSMPGGEQWLTAGAPQGPPVDFTSRRRSAPRVVEGKPGMIQQAVAGIGLVADFLGPRLAPVEHELAEARAAVCVTCPNNQPSAMAELAGEGLKLLMEARSQMKLHTSHDEKLHACTACRCNLRLKPHVELDYVLQRLTPDQRARLVPNCWILVEEKARV